MSKILNANWTAPGNVRAFMTLRDQNYMAVIPSNVRPYLVNQVHGNHVVLTENGLVNPQADAIVSSTPGIACVIRTADCLPILISDARGEKVAAIHAGWRSLSARIIANTCAHFDKNLAESHIWLGPSISARSFEVGADVLEQFVNDGWSPEAIEQSFHPIAERPGKWFGDLYNLARIALVKAGATPGLITGGEYCTFEDSERFYSHRRSKDVGRMHSVIYRV